MKLPVKLFSAVASLALAGIGHGMTKAEYDYIVKSFAKSCRDNPALEEATRDKVLAHLKGGRTAETANHALVTEALKMLYPDFASAVDGITSEDYATAQKALEKMAQGEDPYLAAESAYFLARSHYNNQQFEEALPLLEKMQDQWIDKTVRASESLYFKGMSETETLRKEAAFDTLQSYLDSNPDASDLRQEIAYGALEDLAHQTDGSMDDIAAHMDFSRRHLGLRNAGAKTQEVQKQIITMLDALIEQAENAPP